MDELMTEMEALEVLVKFKGRTLGELCTEALVDGIAAGICMGCRNVVETEPDQDAGYCEFCGELHVKSCMVLADLI